MDAISNPSNAISTVTPAQVQPPFALSKLGMSFDDSFSFDDWVAFGQKIGGGLLSARFIIGDWLNFGKGKWSHDKALRPQIERAIHSTGLELTELKRCARVSRETPVDERQLYLSFEAQSILSRLNAPDRKHWALEAIDKGFNAKQLKREIRAEVSTTNEPKYESVTILISKLKRRYDAKITRGITPLEAEQALTQLRPIYEIIERFSNFLN